MALAFRSLFRKSAKTEITTVFLLIVCTAVSHSQAADPVAATSAALRNGDFEAALRISAAALKQIPGNIQLLTLRGLAYAGERKPAIALAAFQKALKESPAYLPALEGAAQVAVQQEGGNPAKPFLLRILSQRPGDLTANAMLAGIDYRAGDCPEAVEHFQKAQTLLLSQPASLAQYGACLASMDRLADAIPVLRQAVELNPVNRLVRYNLALAQWNTSQPDEALQTLAPLLSDSMVPEDVLTLAADICESKNDTQRAVEVLRQAILAHPKDKSAYLQFAYLSYNHSSVQVGIDMVNLGLTQLPNEAELYVARGVLLSQTSDSTKAGEDFDTAMRLNPTLSFAGIAEGIAKSQAHDAGAALATFRVAARQHPDDGLTQYLLAEALSEQAPAPGTTDFAEELAAAQRSLSLDPKRLETHDLLASLYLRSGNTDLSIQQSKFALQIDPNDEQALYHEILALRKGDQRSDVPGLVKRLMEVRGAKARQAKPNLYRLVETPLSTEHTNAN